MKKYRKFIKEKTIKNQRYDFKNYLFRRLKN